MATVVLDRGFAEILRKQRAEAGTDRWDEVWEGTYIMAPLPDIEHQDLVGGFVAALRPAISRDESLVYPGINVSDRQQGWEHNYRCPDVAVFLANSAAKDCGTFWLGGSDFAIEIASDDDLTRDKVPFYAKVGTQELLIVDRDPWQLELLCLKDGALKSAGVSTIEGGEIASRALPLTFRMVEGAEGGRPEIEVTSDSDGKSWRV